MKIFVFIETVVFCLLLNAVQSLYAFAQVIPDSRLKDASQVTLQNNVFNIMGGTRSGNNLFHSFTQFSIPTGYIGYFNSGGDLKNIFARITGSSASTIDGVLRSNGQSNLFLINPNGIIFGSNAKLNIGGSFLASTSKNIEFSDGTLFDSTSLPLQSIISSGVPIGLNFGVNSGSIHVLGPGHIFSLSNPVIAPITRNGQTQAGLRVSNGKTIALIGNEVALQGGNITAPNGHIELGSISNGRVSLKNFNSSWQFEYGNVNSFNDVKLLSKSSVDASGTGNSSIHFQGDNFEISGGSIALIQNLGAVPSGSISADFSNTIDIEGKASDGFPSRVVNETLGPGDSGNVIFHSNNLLISDGAALTTKTFSKGNAKDINIFADESILLNGVVLDNPSSYSYILSGTSSSGTGGNIFLTTKDLEVLDGSSIASPTSGSGNAGNITINANSAEINGGSPSGLISSILASTIGKGKGGIITLNTSSLDILNGGTLVSITAADGDSGSILVNAKDRVSINGFFKYDPQVSSQIATGASPQTETIAKLFNLPKIPSGKPGDVSISTPILTLSNLGSVVSGNYGSSTDKGGKIEINANYLSIDAGRLLTTSISGAGGDIFLTSKDIRLTHGGIISSSRVNNLKNPDVSGNITINTKLLTLLENSRITANSINSYGGKVSINADDSFVSPNSSITAFGARLSFNGSVIISKNKDVVLNKPPKFKLDALAPLPITCDPSSGKAFYILTEEHMTNDVMDLISASPEFPHYIDTTDGIRKPLILSVGWVPDGNGKLKALRAIPVSILSPRANQKICDAAIKLNKS